MPRDQEHITSFRILFNFTSDLNNGVDDMKRKYYLPMLSLEEKLLFEYLLLDEIDKERWYAIVHLEMWKTEGIICIQ